MKLQIISLVLLNTWIASVNADFFHCICQSWSFHTIRSKEACIWMKNESLPKDQVTMSLVGEDGPWAGALTCRMLNPAKFWGAPICWGQYGYDWLHFCKPECKNDGKDAEDCIRTYRSIA
ncbi:hypothetical protein HER10_EVM0006195 [Colletotrichum scovillei]|uniref:Uncharacterized protein n=1 Tax=Colletotrichum scovillei TaxID=1209932 RepID=A0A9P7ULN8_9PEZI|nr:uncharacterized protein HER10_EVM0006195 [Colletotrichum scovillei]KAF4773891.1 hypothetical protein HER10_EVM0006195 [Colletotrichum scovillei]KAG7056065.1 hypothetical protein JMJ77_0008516 [Colletotrichum scovillei]KAG7075512.1 hypothetical protein JMJ76_0011972 [Colletotrichum scovillei]KAG7082663.1 hypothetical protein JMJ78_0004764 [Colletotrichum scovillei]